jgi:acyl-CoA reductase-like NAD-dependent aldehyde dehydrogenase
LSIIKRFYHEHFGGGNWGNLPAAERTEVIQQVGRELPAHYRELLEAYFRKLAQQRRKETAATSGFGADRVAGRQIFYAAYSSSSKRRQQAVSGQINA